MDSSEIVDNFIGQLKSTLKCTHCGHCSVTLDPFWNLSLAIPERTGHLSLYQCLDSFTREESLDGDEKPMCSRCSKRRRCTKTLSIYKFPRILVINLKRFSSTESLLEKLNLIVDFPRESLDMSHYAADNVAPCKYNLYAISNHSGNINNGHYTAYCRHPYTGNWHEYDDSKVSSISSKSLVSGKAYILFYEQDLQDDSLLPQPNLEEYPNPSPPQQQPYYSGAKKMSLDDRINLELGFSKNDFKPISTTYNNFPFNNFPQTSTPIKRMEMDKNLYADANVSSNFVQLGNMVQIVPTDLDGIKTDITVRPENKSQILQVGNMLQIVPTNLSPDIPLPINPPPPLPPKKELVEVVKAIATIANQTQLPEKQTKSAETEMKQKISERRAERDKRKEDREARRKEKENRRREKEKLRQVKMKEKTENMIKRALQFEVEHQDGESFGQDDTTPVQWPPILNISGSSKDLLNKSILIKGSRKLSKSRRKIVHFADGIKPGEGTSPSAGELSSPPPSKVLPKEKRYTKTKLRMKNMKKKFKVKIIKSAETELDESEDEDNLPRPSPPPGSPPPHVFPPRVKQQNSHHYVQNVMVNQNQQNLYRQNVNMMMMSQTLPHARSLQQYEPPPLPDSPMHSYVQYQMPPLPPSPPPPDRIDSSLGNIHRNQHFNYSL